MLKIRSAAVPCWRSSPLTPVRRARAMDYVAGYTVCNDYAIRDYLENYYRPNLRVKSRDTLRGSRSHCTRYSRRHNP